MDQQEPIIRLRPKNEGEELKISETVLRKRNRDLKSAAQRAWVREEAKKNVKRLRKIHLITSAEKHVLNHRQEEVDKRRYESINKQPFPRVKAKSRVVFVIRNSLKHACEESKSVLMELGMSKYFGGRFVSNTSEMLQKLRLVEPFVFWGTPSLSSIKLLFLRRGCVKSKGSADLIEDDETAMSGEIGADDQGIVKRKLKREWEPLSDNSRIEDELGYLGLLCVEDLVNETYRCGPHFQMVQSWTGPFQMSNPVKVDGLDSDRSYEKGNIGIRMNDMIQKIC
eukprot:Lankesteria_metandrocarpae@DN3226_c0_g1_i1.p1